MKTAMKTASAVLLAAAALVGPAQGASESGAFVNPKDVKWGPAPPSIGNGVKLAVLQGDPGKAGPFVIRLMVPAGARIAPHWHSRDESLTVIAGTLDFGTGDEIRAGKGHALTAGAFHFLSGNDRHYLVAKSQAVVQVNGNGPFDIHYVGAEGAQRRGQ